MSRNRIRIAVSVALLILLVPLIAHAGEDFESAKGKGYLTLYLAAFVAGFFTSLTPCVYPMIPITVSIFGARGEQVSRGKSFLLASAYVGGMATLYTVLGVVFAMLGKNMGTLLASPYVVIPLVTLFLVLAASMFGAFEMQLPQSWQNKLNTVGGNGFLGAFGMGLVGGLIAAPCVGPFLGGLLTYVTTTQDVFLGGSTLFVFALGMGILFWVIAVFSVNLPKSGGWMEWVKSVGGVGLIVVAIYFLRPLIPAIDGLINPATWFGIAAAAIAIVGLVGGAVHLTFHGPLKQKLRKGAAVVAAVVGVTGVWFWWMSAPPLPWEYDEKVAFARAEAENKGVMIDFSATWCAPCKKLEKTFAADGVREDLLANYVPLKFDVTEDTDRNDDLQDEWEVDAMPTVIFVDAKGNELARLRGEYIGPGAFRKLMDPATEALRGATPASAQNSATEGQPDESATSGLKGQPAGSGDDGKDDAPKADTGDTGDTGKVTENDGPSVRMLPWRNRDTAAAFTSAKSEGKGVMLDFSAEWCGPCIDLEKTFASAGVYERLVGNYVPVKIDITEGTDHDEKLQSQYQAGNLPAVIFLDADGTEKGRITKYLEPQEFLAALDTFAPAK